MKTTRTISSSQQFHSILLAYSFIYIVHQYIAIYFSYSYNLKCIYLNTHACITSDVFVLKYLECSILFRVDGRGVGRGFQEFLKKTLKLLDTLLNLESQQCNRIHCIEMSHFHFCSEARVQKNFEGGIKKCLVHQKIYVYRLILTNKLSNMIATTYSTTIGWKSLFQILGYNDSYTFLDGALIQS